MFDFYCLGTRCIEKFIYMRSLPNLYSRRRGTAIWFNKKSLQNQIYRAMKVIPMKILSVHWVFLIFIITRNVILQGDQIHFKNPTHLGISTLINTYAAGYWRPHFNVLEYYLILLNHIHYFGDLSTYGKRRLVTGL
jgi:hypothetical protein